MCSRCSSQAHPPRSMEARDEDRPSLASVCGSMMWPFPICAVRRPTKGRYKKPGNFPVSKNLSCSFYRPHFFQKRGSFPFFGRAFADKFEAKWRSPLYSDVKLDGPGPPTRMKMGGRRPLFDNSGTRPFTLFNFQRSGKHYRRHLTMRTASFRTAPRILFTRQRTKRSFLFDSIIHRADCGTSQGQ